MSNPIISLDITPLLIGLLGIIAIVVILVIVILINENKSNEKSIKEYKNELFGIERELSTYKSDYTQSERHYKTELQKKEKELGDFKIKYGQEARSAKKAKDRIGELLFELNRCKETIKGQELDFKKLSKLAYTKLELIKVSGSNLSAIPYMSQLIADYETIGMERLAAALDWGSDVKREKKVQSIREIREEAKQIVERNKYAQYQLAYLLELYPGLQDIIDSDYNELPIVNIEQLNERDPVRNYLENDEYNSLSTTEKNQLALDRYVNSHNKSKWQIGRDYELFVGHQFLKKRCSVEFFGSNMGLEDLGRDLIVKDPNGKVFIIQCKYWSKDKVIHEKHITQLYGTTISYCIENNIPQDNVQAILITNIELSEMAKKMANYLQIKFVEKYELGEFPRIKCNNGIDQNGIQTKIYHLPFDQQYDNIKMIHKDDFWAYTVEEASNVCIMV